MGKRTEFLYLNEEESKELKVALGAVLLKNGKSGVFVFQPQDQKIQFKEVDLIRLTSDGQAIITSTQLKAGDVVVSAGTHSINDGETVRPLPAQTLTNVGGLL